MTDTPQFISICGSIYARSQIRAIHPYANYILIQYIDGTEIENPMTPADIDLEMEYVYEQLGIQLPEEEDEPETEPQPEHENSN